jgi:Flp pilus assembly protein CpaB
MSSWPRLRLRDDDAPATDPAEGATPKLRPHQSAASTRTAQLKRLREPLPLIGIALVLIAFVGYLAVYTSTTHRTPVLVTTRALPAGTKLRASDLRSAELAGDGSVIAGLEPESRLGQVVGQRLQTALPTGTPLPRTALAARAPAASAMTLAVPALHALGGALQPGDRVTVLATFGAGIGQARSLPVARGVQVLAVGETPASADQASAMVAVTLALADPSIASKLALASNDGKLDLLREGKGAATAPIPPARNGDRP